MIGASLYVITVIIMVNNGNNNGYFRALEHDQLNFVPKVLRYAGKSHPETKARFTSL